eukprot:scaffold7381_cov310-Pinguiococcus_pyrenoidosus.AAC.83
MKLRHDVLTGRQTRSRHSHRWWYATCAVAEAPRQQAPEVASSASRFGFEVLGSCEGLQLLQSLRCEGSNILGPGDEDSF